MLLSRLRELILFTILFQGLDKHHFHNLEVAFAVFNPLCPSTVTNLLKVPHNNHSYYIPFAFLFFLSSRCTGLFKREQMNIACSPNSANYISRHLSATFGRKKASNYLCCQLVPEQITCSAEYMHTNNLVQQKKSVHGHCCMCNMVWFIKWGRKEKSPFANWVRIPHHSSGNPCKNPLNTSERVKKNSKE